jgi:preprotein translocase subunit SecB
VEQTPNPADQKKDSTPQEQFGIQNVYIKDISFETPHSPHIFAEQWKPQMELEMSNDVNNLNEGIYEVILNLTATVKIGEKTAFLVEVHQAGIFAIKGFAEDRLSYMLNSYCPNVLFPYAREMISSIVARGGFQPLWLAPINFDAVYAQRVQQQKQQQQNPQPTTN